MRLLSPEFVAAFPDRIVNIHPSLLPSYPGLDAQRQAIDDGAVKSGCTVHYVDEHLDHGDMILQREVPVMPDDTVQTLSERILKEEHIAYVQAVKQIINSPS